MTDEFRLPELGENVETASVVQVLVSAGDEVEKDQGLIEVETDKATVEVPAPRAGKIAKVHVKKGDDLGVDDVIVTFEPDAAREDAESKETRRAKRRGREEEQEQEEEGDGEQEAEEAEEAEEDGERRRERAEDEERAEDGGEAEGDEADRDAGGEREPERPERREREPRRPSTGTRSAERASGVAPVQPEDPARAPERRVHAAPSVRRLAREIGVDLREVEGSGPGGRISTADVKAWSRGERAPRPAGAALGDLERWGEVEREPQSGVRRTIAQRMRLSWTTAPHVTLDTEADVTDVEAVRQRYKHRAAEAGGRLSITAILIKVCASALRLFPRVNSSLDAEREELVLKKYVHVGVAVDTERGLLVPVLRDVDRKNVLQLSVELAELSQRARDGKLAIDDMRGACFTVTNLGSLGVTTFTPILNPPETAVLGVGRARTTPVYVEGELAPRLLLPLSLSFDHRVLDGADAARFLEWVKKVLEDPLVLAIEG